MRTQYDLSAGLEGWYVGSALIGSLTGVGFAGWLSDKYGRKMTLLLSGSLFSISAIGCAIASGFSDFAKIPVPKIEKIELVNILQNAIDIFNNRKKYSIELKYSGEKNYFIIGDKNQMIRVFNNLIKNSIQAMSDLDFGKIIIKISSSEKEHIIKITDNGTGIPEGQTDNIFSPSFTTKSSGTGLGLAIVKSIISEAGGEISFKSEEGNGTTFEIRLPIYK